MRYQYERFLDGYNMLHVLVISKQMREVQELRVLALERIDNNTHSRIGENGFSGSLPIEIKVSTALNCAGPINSEYKGWSKLEGRVNEISIRIPALLDGYNVLHVLRHGS